MLKGVEMKFLILLLVIAIFLKVYAIEEQLDKHHKMTIIGLNVCGKTLDDIERELRYE